MAIIDDLKQSIASMPDDILMDLMIDIRKNRRKVKPKKKKKSQTVDLTLMASKLNPSAAATLLKALKGRISK